MEVRRVYAFEYHPVLTRHIRTAETHLKSEIDSAVVVFVVVVVVVVVVVAVVSISTAD